MSPRLYRRLMQEKLAQLRQQAGVAQERHGQRSRPVAARA
jgi:hypothetical protein